MDWKWESYLSRTLRGDWGLLNHGLSWSKITKLSYLSAHQLFVFSDLLAKVEFIILLFKDSTLINRNPLRGVYFMAPVAYQTKHYRSTQEKKNDLFQDDYYWTSRKISLSRISFYRCILSQKHYQSFLWSPLILNTKLHWQYVTT